MLRVTVTRETADEALPIAEVVIGKFGGSEERGTYAARVIEPPSQFSDGVDACFAIRGHERYQPAFALVAEVLSSWQAGRIDDINPGARAALDRSLRLFDESHTPRTATAEMEAVETSPAAIQEAIAAMRKYADDPAVAALAQAIVAVAQRLER